jgi:hypothetical protein
MQTSKALLSLFLTIALSLSNSVSLFASNELKQETCSCSLEITKLEKLIELEKTKLSTIQQEIELQKRKNDAPYSAEGMALMMVATAIGISGAMICLPLYMLKKLATGRV